MKLHTLTYTQREGWSAPFPDLDSEKTLVLIFAAPTFIDNTEPLKVLKAHYPQSNIMGCSTAGEISGSYIYDKSLTVAIAKFEKTELKIILKKIESAEDSLQTGKKITAELASGDLKGIFLLSDGLHVNGSELAKGLNPFDNKNIVITGGLAGDGKDFLKTWVICGDKILTNHIVAVGLYGEYIEIGHGSKGGWDVFGPERTVTRAKNNILFELDHKPALTLYKEYLGEMASGLPATGLLYPLAVRHPSLDASEALVRTILAVNESDQSLTFAGDVPTGSVVQLMRANFNNIIFSASEAGSSSLKKIRSDKNINNNPILSIAVSCVGRRLLLGERTEEETESVVNILPVHTKQIGFYSYGELSPHMTGECVLHNQTMTLTTFYER